MDDPRLTPARPDLAAKYLEGKVKAARFVEGETFEISDAIGQTGAPGGWRMPGRTCHLQIAERPLWMIRA